MDHESRASAAPSMEHSNGSTQPDIHALSAPARRVLLRGGTGLALAAMLGPLTTRAQAKSAGMGAKMGFQSIPVSSADALSVPPGYVAQVLAPWGEPLGIAGQPMPAFREDASNSAAEQALQMGMHHDGIHYFPLDGSRRGLLVMNHEYTDDGLLHPQGMTPWTAEKVAKAQAAHGISVIEIERGADGWRMVRPSRHARRITATTPITLSGPAAGHRLMQTSADPGGRTARGTLNNCASGKTPWGTYLAGEENFRFYFAAGAQPDAHQRRYGLPETSWLRWEEHDPRFDARLHPHEPNRFGWIVELDPMDPGAPPIKRTTLGRGAHEGAWVATTRDGRAVVYSGEDARFEYIYKFVSRDRIAPAGAGLTQAQANRHLLDHGTLYVARFDADGSGRWLPLVFGQGPLNARNGFADQGEVLIKARQASDALGATPMDRPEWVAIDPVRRELFCSLTGNSQRGQPGRPGVDAANPRAGNVMGHIIRWTEDGDFDGLGLRWSHLVLAGDPANERPEARGNIRGDIHACPDSLMIDARGLLWIQTDVSASRLNQGEFGRMGNSQMLACDPATGEIRRFATGPALCELTGATLTPDGRTLFINVQHPGEPPSERSAHDAPTRHSSWPYGGRPRSATVAISRRDGGLVGT